MKESITEDSLVCKKDILPFKIDVECVSDTTRIRVTMLLLSKWVKWYWCENEDHAFLSLHLCPSKNFLARNFYLRLAFISDFGVGWDRGYIFAEYFFNCSSEGYFCCELDFKFCHCNISSSELIVCTNIFFYWIRQANSLLIFGSRE